MSNYFSQLIQQTGIPLLSSNSTSNWSKDSAGSDTEMIQVIDSEVVIPNPESSTALSSSTEDSQRSNSAPVTEAVAPQLPVNLESKRLQPNSQSAFEQQEETEAIQTRQISTTEAKKEGENESTPLVENREIREELLLEKTDQSESNISNHIQEDLSNDLHTNVPNNIDQNLSVKNNVEKIAVQQQQNTEIPTSKNTPVTELNLIQIRQTYIEAAREWVSESPIIIEESNDFPINTQVIQPEKTASPNNLEQIKKAIKEPYIPPLEPINQSVSQRPEIQDFLLSIGSINLTIEAPKTQIQPPPPASEPSRTKNDHSSRISRHYL